MASEETRRESEKCLDKAKKAFKAGDKDKAMQLVKKALRMNPNDRANSLLSAIKAGDTRATSTSQRRNTETGAYSSENNTSTSEINKNEADNCLKLAENALHAGNLEKAERLAIKARRMYPSPHADELLKQIQSGENVQNTRGDSQSGNRPSTSQYNHSPGTLQTNANSDTSPQFLEAAEAFFRKGDLNKAEKFVNKAQLYCQTARGNDLLRQILTAKEKVPNGDDGHRRPVETPRVERKPQVERKPKVEVLPEDEPSHNNEVRRQRPEYTEEQLEAIRRVKAAKDDYDILGVPKKSKFAAVKKAFRKLSKLLHPDKNKSAEAGETFMKVTEAVERIKKDGD